MKSISIWLCLAAGACTHEPSQPGSAAAPTDTAVRIGADTPRTIAPDTAAQEDEFAVVARGQKLYLRQWLDGVDLEGLLGVAVHDTVEVLGPGADTHQGSKVRTRRFKDATLVAFSPRGSERWWLLRVELQSPALSTAKGLKVGDGLKRVQELYPGTACQKEGKGMECRYRSADDERHLSFRVEGDTVRAIRMHYLIP